jgi:hypothetical protein
MASHDRRRATALYRKARFWLTCAVGFTTASLIYPGSWPVPPSTLLAVASLVTAVALSIYARWHRRRDL